MARTCPLAATTGQSSSRSHLCARLGADATAAKPNPWPTRPERGRDLGHLLHPWPPSGGGRGTGHISYISAGGQKHVSAPIVGKPALEVLITIQAARWSGAWTRHPRTSDDSGGPSRGKDGPLALRAIINNACPAPASSPTHPGHMTKEAEKTSSPEPRRLASSWLRSQPGHWKLWVSEFGNPMAQATPVMDNGGTSLPSTAPAQVPSSQ